MNFLIRANYLFSDILRSNVSLGNNLCKRRMKPTLVLLPWMMMMLAQGLLNDQQGELDPSEIGLYKSTGNVEGFLPLLEGFIERDLDPHKRMYKENFYPQGERIPTNNQVYWSPMECVDYNLTFDRLKVVKEFNPYDMNNRVVLMADRQTGQKFILKVYGTHRLFLSELRLGRLKPSPFFVTPFCIMPVRLPVRRGTVMDFGDRMVGEEGSTDLEEEEATKGKYKMMTKSAILFEYIDGMPIGDYAFELGKSAGGFSERPFEQIAPLIAEFFWSVCRIHESGLIYHDFKTSNLLVREGHLVIIDYDLMGNLTEPFMGSSCTTSPEQWNILKGPLHFGVDWWGFGATTAIVMARICAGIYDGKDEALTRIFLNYSPMTLDRSLGLYMMNPLPSVLSNDVREFLYPFFSPDPNARQFNTVELQKKIQQSAFLAGSGIDFDTIDKPKISSRYHLMTQEEIRAELLGNVPLQVGNWEDNCMLRGPQLLYKYDELMWATDEEATEVAGKKMVKKRKVAQLIAPPPKTRSNRRRPAK